jgi:hypothetical protein
MSDTTDESTPETDTEIGFDTEQPRDAELFSLRNLLILCSLPFWAVVIWYAWDQTWARAFYGVIFLGGVLELYILSEIMDLAGGGREHILADLKRAYGPGNRLHAGLLTFSAIDVLVTITYIATNFQELYVDGLGRASTNEYIMATVFTFVIIYLTWRSFGLTFLSVIFVGILERITDEMNRTIWRPQMEGGKAARELPGIVDQVMTLGLFAQETGPDGATGWRHDPEQGDVRRLVCRSGNPWGLPAKDRSGRLDLTEPPDLGALLTKINQPRKG